MTCEVIYQMAGRYLTSCRAVRENKTTTRETTTVRPPDASAGTSGGTTTEKVQETVKTGEEISTGTGTDIAILNGVILELSCLADEYARQKGQVKDRYIPREIQSLRDPFPLPQRFAPAAALSLASILCMPLDSGMASQLQARSETEVDSIRRELTGVISPTVDVYRFF